MNFNFSHQPECRLNSVMAREVIALYGITAKIIITEKVNHDQTIFKDFTHLASLDSHEIQVLPEDSNNFEVNGTPFQEFGIINFDNMNLFIHSDSIADICPFNQLIGNLIQLPSNKVMEIVNAEQYVPGINNLFVYSDAKSVYRLTCRPYEFKATDEIRHEPIEETAENEEDDPIRDYDALDEYFTEILNDTKERAHETEVEPTVPVKTENGVVNKPKVDKSVDDVWGQFF